MRILVIAPEQLPIPPITGGSVETCIFNIFRRMAHKENVTLISRTHPRLPRRSKYAHGHLTVVRVAGKSRAAFIRKAVRKVRGKRFDVIQVENRPTFVPFVRKAFPGTPIVLSLHSLTFMSMLRKSRADQILKQVNAVTSVSSFVTRVMKKRHPLHAHKFFTVMPGVDTSKFRPRSRSYKRAIRKRYRVARTFNILFVGRIVQRKGLHTLVRAVSHLKREHRNVNLIAVGASWPGSRRITPYMRNVRRLCRRLGVKIRFTGYIPPARVHNMYHLGDVFACPTQYREGLGLVNLEAMASGIPVVASNRGGVREAVVHNRSGLLVSDYKNPRAFAAAIKRIKASPALAKQLSAGARKRAVSSFGWQSSVLRLRQRYREIRRNG